MTSPPEQRPISTIAREIRQKWVDKNGRPKVNFAAEPYLRAMQELNTVNDYYGYDSAVGILYRFLGNAAHFRGADARRIKAELRKMLKDAS